jgi:programmed cell death 8 (apoptosis-inducing factor)
VGIIDSNLDTVSIWEQPEGLARGEVPKNPEYKRGIVYYLRENQVVGVVLWGVPNRIEDARRLVKGGKKFTDVSLLKNVISIEEDPKTPEEE